MCIRDSITVTKPQITPVSVNREAKSEFLSFMNTEVFSPLRMNDTQAELKTIDTDLVKFYQFNSSRDTFEIAPKVNNSWKWAGGGFISTTEDVIRFLKLFTEVPLSQIQEIKKLKVVGSFLLAYWFYIDGVDTIIRMAADYTVSLGYGANTIIVLLLLVQFVAFPAILLYDRFSRVVGVKKALYFAIGAYCMICLFAYFVQKEWHIYVIAVAIGCFQGGIQSLSTSIYTRIIPQNKAAEFFGFFNMIGKYAAILGPPLMGYIGLVTGSSRLGIISIVILFIAGGLLLTRVDIEEGERMANEVL
mgnify:CR=1 FL=1